MKLINIAKKLPTIIGLLLILVFTIQSTSLEKDNNIIIKGVKYYKCKTVYESDTIESGYGDLTIIRKQIIYYDHFGCDK